jgi:hypothetical protein
VRDFSPSAPQADDMTALVVKIGLIPAPVPTVRPQPRHRPRNCRLMRL